MASSSKKRRRPLSRAEMLARNPVWRANLGGGMTRAQQTDLALRSRLAFDNIIHGRAEHGDPDELAVISNLCLVLCERGIGAEFLPRVKEAQQAILSAQERENAGKAFNFTGTERQALLDLMDLHEQQILLASELDLIESLAEIEVRVSQGDVTRLNRTTPG